MLEKENLLDDLERNLFHIINFLIHCDFCQMCFEKGGKKESQIITAWSKIIEQAELADTVMILSFRTDMPGQTVQSSLTRVYTVCHSICIVWTHYSMVEPHSSNFRVITTNFLGVRIFRKFRELLEKLPWLWLQHLS